MIDTTVGGHPNSSQFNFAENVKFIHFDTTGDLPISKKRNLGCKYSIGDYILHVDDDDVYNKYHAITRVRCLMETGIECVGSTTIPCLEVATLNGFLRGRSKETLMEATLAYTRNFWEFKQFDEKVARGEGLLFLQNRLFDSIKQIPYIFILEASLIHNTNITGKDRLLNNSTFSNILYSNLPEDLKIIISFID